MPGLRKTLLNLNYQDNKSLSRHGKGLFLVIIGPDGSGKTTVAEAIISFWEETFHKVPFYIHGDFSVLPRLKILRILLAKISGRKLPPDTDYTKKHSGAKIVPHSLYKSLLYLSYYFWDYILGHFKILIAKGSNRLVIADRYFYDYFFLRGNMKLPHWLLRLLSCFIPKPDLTVFLDADAEIIYARKNELTIDEIERQQAILGKIKWLPNFIIIDTHNGISQTVEQVKISMMQSISSRFK